MLDVKCNYKSKYRDIRCRLCGLKEESQYHLLAKCGYVRHLTELKIKTKDVFRDSDVGDLKSIAKHIEGIMEFLDP